jgi:signal transduction histidine kinase
MYSGVETSHSLIAQTGHELTVRPTKHPVVVDADPIRPAQVFGNLLNNAATYCDWGGHIWLTTERQGSDVVSSVKDTGTALLPTS